MGPLVFANTPLSGAVNGAHDSLTLLRVPVSSIGGVGTARAVHACQQGQGKYRN